MKRLLCLLFMTASFVTFAGESIIHDDGTGAQISFCLPTHDNLNGKDIEYTTFRISVTKDDKFLLLCDLVGKKSDDGKYFIGTIIIPSEFISSAEILLLGSPTNSSIGVNKKLKVSDFKKVIQKKSWTEQK